MALAACCALASELSVSEPETLQVMLQGGSTDELVELVGSVGGSITHKLPIIDAVGATVTRDQLNVALQSPLITRHIDDLSIQTEPETDDSNCRVGGGLELEFNREGIRWPLYNKSSNPAVFSSLQLSWPPFLGRATALSLGTTKIDPTLFETAEAGSLQLELTTKGAPRLDEMMDLVVSFEHPYQAGSSPHLQQADFSVKAEFTGDCSARLIPGYANNHEDFYYARLVGAEALHQHGITGRKVTVAVLDSGLWEHEALALNTQGEQRILARYDAIRDVVSDAVFDESGHGTHMTSVLAHSGPVTADGRPTGGFKGIAPDVNLVAVKAFDIEGQGGFLDIVRGVQWVVENQDRYAIKVLNLSFAALPRWPYWLDPVNQAVMRAWASGITVVAAAGNEGPDSMTVGSPGNLPYVITVGAMTDSWTPNNRDDDYIPDFSSRGPTPTAHIKPDIVAPGGHITGITRPGSSLPSEHPDYLLRTGEFVMTGSSQASALVSGIAALLLQLEPDLTPDDIKCKLLSSAEPAINEDGLLAYSPFVQGRGMVSATRAVTLGQRGCGNTELDILREIAGEDHMEGPAIVEKDGSASLPGLRTMVSPSASEKGLSRTRKWGVKAHIEREGTPDSVDETPASSPFDWENMYLQEKEAIEKMSGTAVN